MSKWITDRLPTKADTSKEGRWLVWTCYEGQVKQWSYDGITLGQPWQPIVPPEPYVKPKRWVAEWSGGDACPCWKIRGFHSDMSTYLFTLNKKEEYREAAERIAAIYEEVMP